VEQFENRIFYLKMPEDLDTDSDEWNQRIEDELNKAGLEGWESYQVNTLGYSGSLRVYLKRKKQKPI